MQAVARVPGAIFLQPPQYVLDADHRVVHQAADCNGQATERHRIDRQAEVTEHQRGDEDGHRNRHQGDDRRAQGAEEHEQHEGNEHRCADELALERVDG